MERSNSTANTILIIILVILVGFVVWYVSSDMTGNKDVEKENGASLEINLGDNNPETTNP